MLTQVFFESFFDDFSGWFLEGVLEGFGRHFGPQNRSKNHQAWCRFFEWFFNGFWEGFFDDFGRFFWWKIDEKSMQIPMVFFERFLLDFWMSCWWMPKAPTLDPLEKNQVNRGVRHLPHIRKFIGTWLKRSEKFIAKSMKNLWKNVWIFGQIFWLIFGGF